MRINIEKLRGLTLVRGRDTKPRQKTKDKKKGYKTSSKNKKIKR